MPRSGSGSYTLPSGNPVVTGTTIESTWANTTLSDIATTLTDSLSRSGQGGMTAALRLADGTQSAPGVAFANETQTGFYRAGTGEVWAVVQGAQTMNLDANGVTVPSDKATSIEGTFVFNETGADKDARFEGDTDANLLFIDASTDRVGVGTATPSNKLTVSGDADVTGNLGIGTSSPGAKLDVAGGALAGGDATYRGDVVIRQVGSSVTSNGGLELKVDNAASGFGARIQSTFNGTSAYDLSFQLRNNSASWTQRMLLDSSGNLGLGVTPSAWSLGKAIEVNNVGNALWGAAASEIDVSQNAYYNSGWKYAASSFATRYEQNTGVHRWFTAPSGTAGNAISFTQAMTLDASGNLSVQDGKQYFWGTGRTAIQGTSASDTMQFFTASLERARITSGGDLLVGTTTTSGAGGITLFNNGSTGFSFVNNNNASATGYVFSSYRRSSVEIGSITQNGTTAVLFNTTSDRRLKDNIVPAPSASDVIDAIEIVSHDWKSAPDEHVTYGVIAQDLALVAPQAVLQGNDGDEIEKTWGVDYSKLVPMLIKEIQSLRARVAALEAQ